MNVNIVRQELEAIARDFSTVILGRQFICDASTVTWPGYKTGIFLGVNYLEEYRNIIDNRQYTFLLDGGNAVQMYYYWKDGVLTRARLAFYQSPMNFEDWGTEWYDKDLVASDLMRFTLPELEQGDDDIPGIYGCCWSHFRFDYDINAASHDKSHLQHSATNDFRVSSSKIFAPYYFFCYIISSFYPDLKGLIRSKRVITEAYVASKRRSLNSPLGDEFLPFIS